MQINRARKTGWQKENRILSVKCPNNMLKIEL